MGKKIPQCEALTLSVFAEACVSGQMIDLELGFQFGALWRPARFLFVCASSGRARAGWRGADAHCGLFRASSMSPAAKKT